MFCFDSMALDSLRQPRFASASRRSRRFVVRAVTRDRGSIWPAKTSMSSRLAFGQRSACGHTHGRPSRKLAQIRPARKLGS
jgi:hypothetical protein